jgi:cyanophycinase
MRTPVMREFFELAGGAHGRLVVIPTAADDVTDDAAFLDAWATFGFESIEVLHTTSRDTANDAAFAVPLTTATAVWFDGGEQARLERAYIGTRVEAGIRAVLERGGVIGGSSAGAAIMSRVMIRGGKTRPRIGTGFDLLAGAIIDQHFLARARQPRLLRALAAHPGLVGYGVDEGTALIVRGGAAEVVGDSSVTVCQAAARRRPASCVALAAGETAELAGLTAEAAKRAASHRSRRPKRAAARSR